jgi:hypothetical protein
VASSPSDLVNACVELSQGFKTTGSQLCLYYALVHLTERAVDFVSELLVSTSKIGMLPFQEGQIAPGVHQLANNHSTALLKIAEGVSWLVRLKKESAQISGDAAESGDDELLIGTVK